MTNTIDRSEVNRALAKALAYKQCGQDAKANAWAVRLVELLQCHNILDDGVRALYRGIAA